MVNYLAITVDGEVQQHEVVDLTPERIYEHIGQAVESLPVPDGWSCVVFAPEERTAPDGQHLRLNNKATGLLRDSLWPGSTIVGEVIIAPPADDEGEFTQDIPEETLAHIMGALNHG